jgi:phospholipid/cholesterol/gamma-HCH transport system ATP-binding protein
VQQSSSNTPVVEAIGMNVVTAARQKVLVAAVDWVVMPGEYWVIGGPHGSGKTDLLMTAAGLHRPDGGFLRLFGQDPAQLSEAEALKQRTRIGFVFKGGGRMFVDLTVAENIALPLCYHHGWSTEQAREEVQAMLELTKLTALAAETAHSLRPDLRQRVGLARALALKPEVLFLDEPAAGLEAGHRNWWRDFLGRLSDGSAFGAGQKTTVIVATSDFSLWHEDKRRYALVKDKRWQILKEHSEYPQID